MTRPSSNSPAMAHHSCSVPLRRLDGNKLNDVQPLCAIGSHGGTAPQRAALPPQARKTIPRCLPAPPAADPSGMQAGGQLHDLRQGARTAPFVLCNMITTFSEPCIPIHSNVSARACSHRQCVANT